MKTNLNAPAAWQLIAFVSLLSGTALAQGAPPAPAAPANPVPPPAAAPAVAPGGDLPPAEVTPPGAPATDTTNAAPAAPTNPPPTVTEPTQAVGVVPVTEPPPSGGEGMAPTDPLAGFTGETAYIRSADNEFQLMPNGRVQVDGYFFKRDTDAMPTPSILIRRARLELAGWIGPWAFFNIAGDFASSAPAPADPVAQSWIASTDDFVGVAPWGELAMLQVGQFDAPFTLENRTSDKYFDFMERSMTVRAFGVPSNKETGAMVHGMLPNKGFYYSAGLFNGDGQNFRNVDSKFDVIGRAWVNPFALAGVKEMKDFTIGGSFWHGTREKSLKMAAQTTQGQFSFLDNTFTLTDDMGVKTDYELHQQGTLNAFALELNAPITRKFGGRFEFVHKDQELAAVTATNATKASTFASAQDLKLKGWGAYGQVWFWVVGDDSIMPSPGLQLPSRLKKFEVKAPRDGVMLTARIDAVNEKIQDKSGGLDGNGAVGTHTATGYAFGVNYWHSKRYRATFNYVLNHFGGDAASVNGVKTKLDGNSVEHEFLFRLAVAL